MKPSLTFVPVRLGLAAAAPQSNPDPSKYALSKDFPDRIKKTLEDLKAQKQDVGKAIGDVAQQVGWQVTGSLPGAPPHRRTSQGRLEEVCLGGNRVCPHVWRPRRPTRLPRHHEGHHHGIFNAESPELAAKAEMKGKRFSDESTYEHLCNNCQPHLTISWLGRLNGCTKDKVVKRDARQDHVRAPAGNPVRPSASKDEQIGLLLSSWIGGLLLENIHLLDMNDFRNAMRPACSGLLKDEKGVCPSKEVFQKAEDDFPSLTFCAPGKVHKSRQ
ncbi:hypothetical protein MHUMG1_07427 [Metarhizium humberi]|uniref:Uncharacterized protein n=1 Tax=Metarhizium humberi TaxID=2596975 RepID=A0A9P8M6A3_9HYPO|nr:hypothetical protein MHUMG1_07427 [Metarhizium humberi]